MKRWLVVQKFYNLWLPPMSGWKPVVTYRYYRWRWQARLAAWMATGSNLMGMSRASVVGRITLKG